MTRNPSKGLRKLAQIPLTKSEIGSHKVFREHGQSLPVPISRCDLVSKSRFPYVKFGDWFKYIIEFDLLENLVGTNDLADMQCNLTLFWQRFKASHPDHKMYDPAGVGAPQNHSMTIPVVVHGDEGRGRKKKQLMVLSCMGVLGKGSSRHNKSKDADVERPLFLNMLGNSSTTHFLHSVMPIGLYNATPDAYFQVLNLQAEEFTNLFTSGVQVQGRTYYIACVGCKGDAPYLAKSGQFTRNFARKPTSSKSKKPAEGICHQCLAGKEGMGYPVPFEEIGVENPMWLRTMYVLSGAPPDSPYMKIPFERDGTPGSFEKFFRFDLFHNVHLGVGKAFISSAVCMVLELLVGYTIGGAFDKLTDDFKDYCQRVKKTPYHKKLTSTLFGVNQSFKDCPAGGWNKGDHTTLLIRWFQDYCERHVVGHTADPVYLLCVSVLHFVYVSVSVVWGHFFCLLKIPIALCLPVPS